MLCCSSCVLERATLCSKPTGLAGQNRVSRNFCGCQPLLRDHEPPQQTRWDNGAPSACSFIQKARPRHGGETDGAGLVMAQCQRMPHVGSAKPLTCRASWAERKIQGSWPFQRRWPIIRPRTPQTHPPLPRRGLMYPHMEPCRIAGSIILYSCTIYTIKYWPCRASRRRRDQQPDQSSHCRRHTA